MSILSFRASGFDLSETFGYIFISLILTTALWGASAVQLYIYFERHAASDHWLITLPLAAICMLDTIHQVTFVDLSYTHLIERFGDIVDLDIINFEGSFLIILTAFINLLVQAIFVLRIWHLSKQNILLTSLCIFLILSHFAITLAYFGMSLSFTHITQFSSLSVFSTEIALNAIGFVTDLTIAGSLATLLFRARRISPFRKTNSKIRTLMLYFISTGFIMDVCSLSALLTTVLYKDSLIPLMILLMYPKLYVNSVLALLNSRRRQRKLQNEPIIAFSHPSFSFPMLSARQNTSLDTNDTTVEFATMSQCIEAKNELEHPLPREIEVEVSVETERFSRILF